MTPTTSAAIMVLAAMAVLGLVDNFVTRIAEAHGLWQFHVVRSALVLPLLAVGAFALGLRLRPRRWGAVAARSGFVAGGMMVYFGCLAFLPIGQVAAGLFTAPIFVTLISAAVLGHRVRLPEVAAVALGFVGILLILRPEGGALSPVAAVPVLGGLLYAIGQLGTREWCAGESTGSLLAGFFAALGLMGLAGLAAMALLPDRVLAGASGEAAFVLRAWEPPDSVFWIFTVIQGLGSIVGVGLLSRAYQIAEARRVAVFEYALLVFASLWAWALWDQTIPAMTAAGMALIVAAGTLISRAAAPAVRPA